MIILVNIGPNIISSDYLCYTNELVIVVAAFEEWLFSKHHSGQHAPSGPNIELIIVVIVPK